MARNAHKAIVGGLVVGGIQPMWIPMRLDTERQLAHPPGPQEVAETPAEHPDATGVLIVTRRIGAPASTSPASPG